MPAQIPQPTPSLVSIGTHHLSYTLSGTRNPGDPIVIVLTGSGDASSSYPALERLLRPFTQTLLYDRSGLGKSETDPSKPTAIQAAKELRTLLTVTQIPPPLLLVAHSYGGIIAREYLHLHPETVEGMVLVDAATERHEYFQVPDENIAAVMGELSYAKLTNLRPDSKLTREEWRDRAGDFARGTETAAAEGECFREVCENLKAKEQFRDQAMGDKPVSVIRGNSARDYRMIYDRGVQAGNGSEEQREKFRDLLGRWDSVDRVLQEQQLRLSRKARMVRVEDCGHNVHLVRPDVIAEEVRWVRDEILRKGKLDES